MIEFSPSDCADVSALLALLESGAVSVDDILEEARSACVACGIPVDSLPLERAVSDTLR